MRQKSSIAITFALCAAVLFSCKNKQYLSGYYSQPEFVSACAWKTKIDDKYSPDPAYIDSINQVTNGIDMQVFLGTYCPDSKKWVPRFFKMRDQLPIEDLQIISVDTTKMDTKGIAAEVGLYKIPTFIFYKDGVELGRIVENPEMQLEKRIFYELKKM